MTPEEATAQYLRRMRGIRDYCQWFARCPECGEPSTTMLTVSKTRAELLMETGMWNFPWECRECGYWWSGPPDTRLD